MKQTSPFSGPNRANFPTPCSTGVPGLGDGLVIPKMVEFKEVKNFSELRLPRQDLVEDFSGKSRVVSVHNSTNFIVLHIVHE